MLAPETPFRSIADLGSFVALKGWWSRSVERLRMRLPFMALFCHTDTPCFCGATQCDRSQVSGDEERGESRDARSPREGRSAEKLSQSLMLSASHICRL